MMYKPYKLGLHNPNLTLKEKIQRLNFSYFFLISLLAAVGVMMLYSASNGSWDGWAMNHAVRFAMGLAVMLVVSLFNIKLFLRYAYPFYFATLVLLIIVEVAGHTGMGATRWIDLKIIKLQPSELMKIALVAALARYFHTTTLQNIETLRGILPPLLMALVPAFLIILQPDLGTAVMLLCTAGVIFFVVGVQIWKFVAVGGLAAVLMPIPKPVRVPTAHRDL